MKSLISIIPYLPIIFGSLLLTYLFPLSQLVPLTIFWIFMTILVLRTALSDEAKMVIFGKDRLRWMIFFIYLAIHYAVYSLAIELLLGQFSQGNNLLYIGPPFAIYITPFSVSPSLTGLALSLILNPTLLIHLSDQLVIELSFYSISMGLLISFLVTSSLMIVISTRKRLKYLALVPMLGILVGASCCVSIPVLLATSIEAVGVVLLTTFSWEVVFIAYVILPLVTVIVLKHLSNSLLRLMS
ncbi:hypothetical protein SUSAZ_10590 [Sulfolobus acidocaldarius SUSAZ]|nr:hypothetical protein SUSAZ_10590 [Sulfolobus acidocaldarius SUSAZ]